MLCSSGALDRFRSSDGSLPSESNITSTLESKVGRDLHLQNGHPLNTIKGIIEGHFDKTCDGIFHFADDRSPVVTRQMNFDDLLIPSDHVSRSPNDTYYIDETHLLRTHTRSRTNTPSRVCFGVCA
jgi:phenylalanyl-tRNA synthetase alpha chain